MSGPYFNPHTMSYSIDHEKVGTTASKPDIEALSRENIDAKKESMAEYKRKWRLANKEKIREHKRRYREKNRAKLNKYNREWRERTGYKYKVHEFIESESPRFKKCVRCGEVKNINDFYISKTNKDGKNSQCKSCIKAASKERSIKKKKILKEYSRNWYQKNKKRAQAMNKEWNAKNKDKCRAMRKRSNTKARSTTKGRLLYRMSAAINRSLRLGTKKGAHWEDLVGYTVDELIKHLEKQFTPEMYWENHGSYWHIDHIIPVAAFNFEYPQDIDFAKCWALKNLRPLEARINQSKQDKLERPFQPSLTVEF